MTETEFPYVFVAPRAFSDLVGAEGAGPKLLPLLPRIVTALRSVVSSSDKAVWSVGLNALCELSDAVGPNLNPHLGPLLAPLGRKMFDRAVSGPILDALQRLEMNGGPDALQAIKTKIPTYGSVA
jgi:hypothetical protein